MFSQTERTETIRRLCLYSCQGSRIFYYMLVTFYHASLPGINTPSFFLAILIFFLKIIIHPVIFNFRIIITCCAFNRSWEVSVLSASCFSLCQKVTLFNSGYFTPCVSHGRSGTEHHHCIFI